MMNGLIWGGVMVIIASLILGDFVRSYDNYTTRKIRPWIVEIFSTGVLMIIIGLLMNL